MNQIEQEQMWEKLGCINAYFEERKIHIATLARNAYAAIAGYFSNTMVLRNEAGEIVQLTNYHADHTMRTWRNGEWLEGRWLINNGNGSHSGMVSASIIFHTRQVDGKSATWRHPFAAHKTVGDRWISPEMSNGNPTYPLFRGGVPVIFEEGKLVVEGTGIFPGAMFSLEEGYVEPPKIIAEYCPLAEEKLDTFYKLGDRPNKAMEGYFGNTMVMRDPDTNQIVHILYYRPDYTCSGWRDGHWGHGTWVLNNAQDNSILFQSRSDMYGCTASWSHAFSPYKNVGDRWVAPESMGGQAYPLNVGGISVDILDGKPVVSGTGVAPMLVWSLEEGIVPPE